MRSQVVTIKYGFWIESLITACEPITLEMHKHRSRNSVKGILVTLILLSGVGLFFAFSNDFFSGSSPWKLIAIIGVVVIAISLGISVITRARGQQRRPSNYEIRIESDSRPYGKTIGRKEEDDFVPTYKVNRKVSDKSYFCNYCGVKIEEKTTFCINCGHRLDRNL